MRIFFTVLLFSINPNIYCQALPTIDSNYLNAYETLNTMMANKEEASFKNAVFVTENAYLKNSLDYKRYNEHITKLATLISYSMAFAPLHGYSYPDSESVRKNYAIFNFFKDTLKVLATDSSIFMHLPYTYDFNDFSGSKDWRDVFVTKLLLSYAGTCHSLPYLYKILADELGATCWLALAPNHMYIKNRCKRDGWYNTELTSGTFPVDAWIMTSGYVPVDAVKSGIYMDTLSNQQAIALCVLDLAKEYEQQTKNYYDGFITKCCNLSLQYFPLNVQAMLLKAETLKRVYERQAAQKSPSAKDTYTIMQNLYIKLLDLGYQEMPDKMYQHWLFSIQKEKEKYNNNKVSLIR
jgi:hypothetical protein